ncbi:MAG: copper chaperone PCu(A)C [Magnetospirillum gryphiswaldense]|nr:copper chaperone PCu(A)C [Magnetospirillum gryphiswaldense]
MKKLLLAAAAIAFAFPALAADLEVTGAFIRASPKVASSGAGFVTIKNTGKQDDKLVAASANVSKSVELHTHIKDGEIMRMRKVESIAVPAGGAAELKPGGDHIMFIDLNAPLKEGDKVDVTLSFEKGGQVKVSVPVVGIGAMAAPMGMDPNQHMQHMQQMPSNMKH